MKSSNEENQRKITYRAEDKIIDFIKKNLAEELQAAYSNGIRREEMEEFVAEAYQTYLQKEQELLEAIETIEARKQASSSEHLS